MVGIMALNHAIQVRILALQQSSAKATELLC